MGDTSQAVWRHVFCFFMYVGVWLSLASYTPPVGGGCRSSVCKVQTRHGASKWPRQYPTFGGGDKARTGSERRLCVREYRHGGVTLLCMTPATAGDLNL